MRIRKTHLMVSAACLTLLMAVTIPAMASEEELQIVEPAAADLECGKMYLWGREVQNEPYNREASLARCKDSPPSVQADEMRFTIETRQDIDNHQTPFEKHQ